MEVKRIKVNEEIIISFIQCTCVRKLICVIPETFLIYNFLINNERRLKFFGDYLG